VNYEDYLQTEHWQTMRRLALEASDGACALCDSAADLEVHHRTYARLGHERLRDLVVLCAECHGRHHGKLAEAQNATSVNEIEELHRELAIERRGAEFLAAEVSNSYLLGIEEGLRRAKQPKRRKGAA
jgi:hypothetical protein